MFNWLTSCQQIIPCGLLIFFFFWHPAVSCVFHSPGFSESRFFRVQVFQDPGFSGSRFFWVQVFQCPWFSGSRFFRVQVFLSPGFSGARFFKIQVFLGPGFSGCRFFRVWVQGSGPWSGSRFQKQPLHAKNNLHKTTTLVAETFASRNFREIKIVIFGTYFA